MGSEVGQERPHIGVCASLARMPVVGAWRAVDGAPSGANKSIYALCSCLGTRYRVGLETGSSAQTVPLFSQDMP